MAKARATVRSTSKTAKASRPPAKATSGPRASASKSRSKSVAATDAMGLPLQTWISRSRNAKGNEARSGSRAFLIALDAKTDGKKTRATLASHLNKWQMDALQKSDQELSYFQGVQGPVCVVRFPPARREMSDLRDASLTKSPYARGRDLGSAIFSHLMPAKADKWILEFDAIPHEYRRGLMIGLELASYTFAENRGHARKPRKKLPMLLSRATSEEFSARELQDCSNIALSTNLARHLVNLPAGDLTPRTYADLVVALFASSASIDVTVWEGSKLVDERMNLLNAVGGAALDGPRLVHISYRPKNARMGQAPIAFVGKGITFDTGGLDIKPSSAMRLMKKDMGGSAACVGLAKWAEASELDIPLDIYLSLAENAVGSASFRPGDIVTARNGLTIEIHNTDAEGRLVLADALDVAISQNEKPAAVIDLATLTGAIKVGLGGEIAGLFSNNDALADALLDAGTYKGDLAWRMPLFQPYKAMLRSTFADYANASEGFAGAITAALFLELFTGKVPWAHLDIYSWKDGAGGPYSESGGNGQPVQMLAEFLTRLSESADVFAPGART